MNEQIYTWVFCEVFVVRNFNFLLVWIICSHIYSFCLLTRLHLQRGVFWHCAICIDCALVYAGYVLVIQQNMDVCRGAVLALGFIIGRIPHHKNNSKTPEERMDVDNRGNSACSRDSASLHSVVCSAVCRLGEYFAHYMHTSSSVWKSF